MRAMLLTLALCACATPYQTGGLSGGVQATQLGGDLYRIEARLNGYSSRSMLQDYTLLRAAETARERGAAGFVIIDAQSNDRNFSYTTQGSAYTTGSVQSYGNYSYGQATTTYNPGQTFNFVKPGGITMIRLVNDPATPGFFNADELIAAIGPRVSRRTPQPAYAPEPQQGYAPPAQAYQAPALQAYPPMQQPSAPQGAAYPNPTSSAGYAPAQQLSPAYAPAPQATNSTSAPSPHAGYSTAKPSSCRVAFEMRSGAEKVCQYNCDGSPYAVTIGATDQCPTNFSPAHVR